MPCSCQEAVHCIKHSIESCCRLSPVPAGKPRYSGIWRRMNKPGGLQSGWCKIATHLSLGYPICIISSYQRCAQPAGQCGVGTIRHPAQSRSTQTARHMEPTVGQAWRVSLGDMHRLPQVVAFISRAVESIQEDEKGNVAWILRSKKSCGISMP